MIIQKVGDCVKKNLLKEVRTEPYDIVLADGLWHIPHFHKEFEIIFVIEGEVIAHADRNEIRIFSGDVFISFPNQIHFFENSVTGKYGVFIFSTDIIFGEKDLYFDNIPENNVIHLKKDDELYKDFTELIKVKETKNKDIITVGIMNYCFGKLLNKITLKPRLKTDNFTLQNIINYCTLNFASSLSLDDVAQSLHLSKYYVSYLFNNKLGIGFNDFLNSLRIKASCDFLAQTDKNMSDISQEVGFGSIRSFNRVFTRIMGVTPSEYRKNR